MTVHQAIAWALHDNGVDTLFGLMGDANMFMVDSFVRECGGTYVAAAHEVGSALMALGYAAISGKAGACSVTHGPAMTNTVTALVEGVKGTLPMILLCGDTAVEDRENLQSVSQREFVIAAGAGFEQLRSPATAVEDVSRALRRAMVERRPVALNIPYEFDWAEIEYQPIRVQLPENRAIVPSSDDLDNAVGVIAAARRPIVLAGRGATSADARAAILRLARRIEAPVATTLKSKDLFLGEPENLGIFGTLSTPAAVEAIIDSDCVVAFGASLNQLTTSKGAFVKGKRVVQVNLEPAEVAKNAPVDVGLVGDPAGMADVLVHWLDEAEIPSSGYCQDELKRTLAEARPEPAGAGQTVEGTVDFQRALSYLDRLLPADRVLVTDGGRFMSATWNTIRSTGPGGFYVPLNFAAIGLGLSHAIGASFAAPARPTVLFAGDGGFMNGGLAEFNTAVRAGCDLIVVICNDSAYGAEHIKFRRRQMDPGLTFLDWPDFAPIAVALGGEGVTVRSEADFAEVERAIVSRRAPLLIDLKLDPDRMSKS